VTEIGDWSRKIVEVYMQWYTFFVTANLLIMGWFYSKEIKVNAPIVPLARLFQFLNVLGAISTGLVGYFVSGQVAEFSKLIKWSAFSNCVGLIGIAYVWGMINS
jgi:hypothetical protein